MLGYDFITLLFFKLFYNFIPDISGMFLRLNWDKTETMIIAPDSHSSDIKQNLGVCGL